VSDKEAIGEGDIKPGQALRYVTAIRAVSCHWVSFLGGAEIKILLFIIERTFRWSKDAERISAKHFTEGMKRKEDGYCIHEGTALSHNTVRAALRSLQEKGLVSVSEERDVANNYQANLIELDFKMLVGRSVMSKLRIPKVKKTTQNGPETGGQEQVNPSSETGEQSIHNKVDTKRKNQTLSAADATENVGRKSFDTAAEAITTSNLRIRRSREVKAASAAAAPGAPKLNEFRALWQQHMLQHWPTVPVVSATQAEWGMFKKALASVENTVPLSELVEYAIAGWSSIINIDLHWMKDVKNKTVGLAPDMVFFIRHVKHFMKSIAKHKATDDSNLKRVQVSPEKKQENENAELRRQLAKVTAENRRLAEKARSDERIMQEMDRKKDARPASIRQPLTRAQLRPVEDDDNLPRNWNGQ
jgi:DNA-binding transcriptional ArsR family regulator